ncbi:MAG: VTT domain-containing protein [Candidatus Moranbacteria bacterium]|nr:VTT domain-containing protein [Candidatus Moranbacteria bacterium]MBP6033962.1 VTT domain-containing protein [Candidatus Moranbacteria bacterium]MBP7695579.1 VTT domain-containing protein [Candidatus Moranbacteria bacterium]
MEYFGVDLVALIQTVGLIGLFLIVFAETGLFLGFFFPGDSLLFVAGLLAAQGFFSPEALIATIAVAAITGNMAGYWFGEKVGPKLFDREDSLLFRKQHVYRAQAFYEEHGAKTIALARFIPIVRTFAPIVAGVAKMRYRTFLAYNIIGGLVWTVGLVLGGYLFGNLISDVDRYLLPVILAIIVVSFMPAVWHVMKERRGEKAPKSGGQ